MIDVRQVFDLGYPYGLALYEVTYTWRDLPDSVKNGEEDHIDHVTRLIEEVLGRGEWIICPFLHDSLWRGIYRPYRYAPPSTETTTEFKEIPVLTLD